jgi:methionyl-tRNA formyltransferase
MLATFVAVSLVMLLVTAARPLREPRVMPVRHEIDLHASALPKWLGAAVIAATALIFVVFW